MPSVRVTGFSGIVPELAPQLIGPQFGQIANDVYLKDGVLRPRYAYRAKGQTTLGVVKSFLYDEGTDTCLPEYSLSRAAQRARPMMQGVVGLCDVAPANEYQARPCDKLRIRSEAPRMSQALGVPLCIPAPAITGHTLGGTGPATVTERPIVATISVVAVRTDGARSVPALVAVAGLDYKLFSDGIQSVQCTFDQRYLDTYAIAFLEFYYSAYSLETGETPNSPARNHIMGFSMPAAASVTAQVTMDSNMTDYALISERNYSLPPQMTVVDVAATDDGHLVVVGNMPSGEGVICVSERYVWNAFPLKTTQVVPETVVCVAAGGGRGVIGTNGGLYALTYAQTKDGAEAQIGRVARAPTAGRACMSDVGGVIVSPEGVFVVTNDTAVNATSTLLNAGDVLYESAPFSEITHLVWRDGIVYGFGNVIGMELTLNSSVHSDRQFSSLTSLTPPGHDVVCVGVDKQGVHVSDKLVGWQVLPYPDAKRSPGLTPYHWKSKTFVQAQITTMAAFKAVGPCDGILRVKIWCDQQLAADFLCSTPDPFRIPSQYRGCEWAIELMGTRSVREIHLATSMAELSEGGQ
jgi:hypothetical protein